MRSTGEPVGTAVGCAESGADWVRNTAAEMQRDAVRRMADAGEPRAADGGGGGDPSGIPGGDGPGGAPGGDGPGGDGPGARRSGRRRPAAVPVAGRRSGGGPRDGPAGGHGGAAPTDGATVPAQDPPPPRDVPWSERPTLELGPNFGDAAGLSAPGRRMTGERLTYRFGPVERRGILGQLRAGQVALVAAGAVAAIVALDREPTAAGAFLGVLLFGRSVAARLRAASGAARPRSGPRSRWRSRCAGVRGRRRFRSSAPAEGMLATEQAGRWRRVLRHPEPGSARHAQRRPDPRRSPTGTGRSASCPSSAGAG